MTSKILASLAVLSLLVAGCSKEEAAVDASCPKVVEKMASLSPGSGEPEKKLWTAACESMPATMRTCIAASKTKEDLDKCGKEAGPIKK